MSADVRKIVEKLLMNNIGIKGLHKCSNQSKSAIATAKNDLKALMNTLSENVCTIFTNNALLFCNSNRKFSNSF